MEINSLKLTLALVLWSERDSSGGSSTTSRLDSIISQTSSSGERETERHQISVQV